MTIDTGFSTTAHAVADSAAQQMALWGARAVVFAVADSLQCGHQLMADHQRARGDGRPRCRSRSCCLSVACLSDRWRRHSHGKILLVGGIVACGDRTMALSWSEKLLLKVRRIDTAAALL